MRLLKLQLQDFRNVTYLELTPGNRSNIIYGDNGHGKTNLLEAAWLFSGARSFRGAKDYEMVRLGQETCSLLLDFEAAKREQQIKIIINCTKKPKHRGKSVWLNEIKLQGAGKLAGVFCAVLFSPDHLLLVKQGPEHRRRMLDASLCQAYPKYGVILESYHRILKQRASLLHDVRYSAALLDLLDAWDKSLVEYGAYITSVRLGYVKRLSEHAKEIYAGISQGKEELSISYSCTSGDLGGASRQDVKASFDAAIKNARMDDLSLRQTTIGPHRDDLMINIDGISARSFGSQGQQRSAVLALKLAECALLEERNGEPPVVLLDDVMSELDEGRRSYLLNRLHGKQIFMTCCDAALFDSLEDGIIFRICEGRLETGKC